MKIALIGGGGVRTPLLVGGAAGRARALGIECVSLVDSAPEPLRLMTLVCQAILDRAGRPFRIEATSDWHAGVAGADFVITSLRPGGLEARVWDERIPPNYGIPGNETTGPGGWALALRSIPVILDYARGIQRLAPRAWLINFSNPAGLLAQAVLTGVGLRTVGICDGPRTLAGGIRQALDLTGDRGFIDYFGLNHLGWVRAVWNGGQDFLPWLLDQPDRLARIYPQPLFSPEEIRALGLIPHEYLHLYYHAADVAAEQRKAGVTRAETLAAINADLWGALGRAAERQDATDALATYEAYVWRRYRTRYGVAGGDGAAEALLGHIVEGYARVALETIGAIALDRGDVLVLNTPAEGALEGVEAGDVVEVPCLVGRDGPRPIAVGSPPDEVRGLLLRVKEYERLTVEAGLRGSRKKALAALAVHPLVDSRACAEALFTDFYRAQGRYLAYLR